MAASSQASWQPERRRGRSSTVSGRSHTTTGHGDMTPARAAGAPRMHGANRVKAPTARVRVARWRLPAPNGELHRRRPPRRRTSDGEPPRRRTVMSRLMAGASGPIPCRNPILARPGAPRAMPSLPNGHDYAARGPFQTRHRTNVGPGNAFTFVRPRELGKGGVLHPTCCNMRATEPAPVP